MGSGRSSNGEYGNRSTADVLSYGNSSKVGDRGVQSYSFGFSNRCVQSYSSSCGLSNRGVQSNSFGFSDGCVQGHSSSFGLSNRGVYCHCGSRNAAST